MSGVRVVTTLGVVEGFQRDGVRRWRAIPYGRPPFGRRRFRAAQPAESWRGVRQCREFTFCAPQDHRLTFTGMDGRRQEMGEDCLSLNVVTPAEPDSDGLPVMFFVHGGGYVAGSSATSLYDGASLARRGCVFVSVNYRLGALGCLDLSSLSTAETPLESNLFLGDIVLALHWVRTNIANFGGDPANVTIFGESAGAHAVATLLAMPSAGGLFHRVIAQSAPAGMTRTQDAAAETAHRFAHHLGWRPEEAAAQLITAPARRLVEALYRVIRESLHETPGAFGLGATIDGDTLPRDPIDAMRLGEAHRIPLIVGHNADEARLFARFIRELPTNRATIDRLLERAPTSTKASIMQAYPEYPRSHACLQIGSDVMFARMAWEMAEAHGPHAPTYLYRYDFSPRPLGWLGFGATHATELLAVFDVYRTRVGSLLTVAGDRPAALRVSNDVRRRWRSFSTTSSPGEDWPRYVEATRSVMVFDRRSRVEQDPNTQRRLAWADHPLVL